MTPSTRIAAAAVAALLMALASCSQRDGSDDAMGLAASAVPSRTAGGAGPHLVALGDSSATGKGDPEGIGWVRRYADRLEAESGQVVDVQNRATANLSSAALADQFRWDGPLREEVASATYVVIGAGSADMNPGDDAWAAGRCSGPGCYTDGLASYKANIETIATEVARLRAGKPTVLRAVTLPNLLTGAERVIPSFLRATATEVAVFQARSHKDSTCTAMRAHGGQCIDVLAAFNGPDGTQNAYTKGLLNLSNCCYASSQGQQLMAELLMTTGFMPTMLK